MYVLLHKCKSKQSPNYLPSTEERRCALLSRRESLARPKGFRGDMKGHLLFLQVPVRYYFRKSAIGRMRIYCNVRVRPEADAPIRLCFAARDENPAYAGGFCELGGQSAVWVLHYAPRQIRTRHVTDSTEVFRN